LPEKFGSLFVSETAIGVVNAAPPSICVFIMPTLRRRTTTLQTLSCFAGSVTRLHTLPTSASSRKRPACSISSFSLWPALVCVVVAIAQVQEKYTVIPKHPLDLAEHGHQFGNIGVWRGLKANLAVFRSDSV